VNNLRVQIFDMEQINVFINMRLELFRELGEISNNDNITELITATKEYFASNIGKNLLSWGIVFDGKIVSVASLCLFSRIPYHENLYGKEGYILNVYTLPSYRKRGMARKLINVIIDYAQENGIAKLWLNTSEQGKSTYTTCGFNDVTNAMERFCDITS
jgi:GNAT superfamily N-acetyltransferase